MTWDTPNPVSGLAALVDVVVPSRIAVARYRPAHDHVTQQQRISAVARHRHKRDTNARRKPRAQAVIAAPLAVLATVSAVTSASLASRPRADSDLARTRDQRILVRPRRTSAAVTRSPAPSTALKATDVTRPAANAFMSKAAITARRSRTPTKQQLDHRRAQHLGPARRQGQAARRARGRQEGPRHRPRDVGPQPRSCSRASPAG